MIAAVGSTKATTTPPFKLEDGVGLPENLRNQSYRNGDNILTTGPAGGEWLSMTQGRLASSEKGLLNASLGLKVGMPVTRRGR